MKVNIKDVKPNDIIVYNDNGNTYKMVAVDTFDLESSTIFLTRPEYWNAEGVYSYTSGGLERFDSDSSVDVIGNMIE